MARTKQEYSYLDLAKEVLEEANRPLNKYEIWSLAGEERISRIRTKSISPISVLNSFINNSVRNGETDFYLASRRPACWGLTKLKNTYESIQSDNSNFEENDDDEPEESDDDEPEESDDSGVKQSKRSIERRLHPLLASYVRDADELGKSYVKTIRHEVTKNKGNTQWIHPDLVGVSYPFTEGGTSYTNGILDLMKTLEHCELVLYSFEMKISIKTQNALRDCFFQALSNSSWANYGYLVAANYNEGIFDEMKSLNETYGIGFIKLNIEDYMQSEILIPATYQKELDWNRVDTLYNLNPDFGSFIDNVRINMKNTKILGNDYDKVFTNAGEYDQYKVELESSRIQRYL